VIRLTLEKIGVVQPNLTKAQAGWGVEHSKCDRETVCLFRFKLEFGTQSSDS